MENRHAYLIIAHWNFDLLGKLLHALDDERNDIFLHVDAKSSDFDYERIKSFLTQSELIMIERKKIIWGHFSIVDCEIRLLKAATESGKYKYYHLISGQDFPLKNQDYIHDFFDVSDLEYITSWDNNTKVSDARNYTYAYKFFYPFNVFDIRKARYKRLNELSVSLQGKIGIDRTGRMPFEVYKGDQWFSITDDFARYLVEKERLIRALFKSTMAPDELFVATLANYSDFKSRIAGENLRLIDWKRGGPYVFNDEDYEELASSDKLFVRKVTYEPGMTLVDRLSDLVTKK